jgi:formate-dependent nitrite reductase membrane component NrfD
MTPMAVDAPTLHDARVTLDVLHTGVIWGWIVTMNMWAKSIGTGALLVGAYLMRRHPQGAGSAGYRLAAPLLGFVFVNVTLLFTLLDLHQPLRFWHMFAWPHLTSSLNLGAWMLTVYNGLLLLLCYAAYRGRDPLYDRALLPTAVLAFFATIYTAGIMGQASAREIWSTPTEVAQMLLSAGVAGSAALLLWPARPAQSTHGERHTLTFILGLSAAVSLTIFLAEVIFAPQKSEEAEFVVHQLLSGRLGTLFLSGLALAFGVPVLHLISRSRSRGSAAMGDDGAESPAGAALARAVALLSLLGLFLVKHAWLIAPQLIPLS